MSDGQLRPSISKAASAVPRSGVCRGKSVIRHTPMHPLKPRHFDSTIEPLALLGRFQGGGGDFISEPLPTAALGVEHTHAGAVVPRIENREQAPEMPRVAESFAADSRKHAFPETSGIAASFRGSVQSRKGFGLHQARL